jgi:predicted nucleic acid-binding protein
MKPMRVYIDTSVFGGCFDQEFEAASQAFFQAAARGQIVPLISATLVRELEDAPERVGRVLRRVMERRYEPLQVSDAAVVLAQAYVRAGAVTEKYTDDALHVALATLARADVIVSWNFKHLVNPLRILAFNAVNTTLGHGAILVMTPSDIIRVLEEGDENENI